MARIPREHALDNTLSLFADPYRYISKRASAHGSDLFQARILLKPTICMTGPEAAKLFYDPSRFQREGAAPTRLQKTLFGKGGVQTLDGADHTHRKQMLLTILSPERIDDLRTRFQDVWREQSAQWAEAERIVFYDEVREVLARAVCAWAGVPLREEVAKERTEQLSDLFEGAGRIGLPHWQARRNRDHLESLIAARIEEVRAGTCAARADSALCILANHRDRSGELLDARIAAVEMLNILRPTVAVAVYITFLAHALASHPEKRQGIGDPAYDNAFVQEVRRLYPFFPAVAAKIRTDFDWNGFHFPAGRRVLLDLHGTNRDARIWTDPHAFKPERFLGRTPGPFSLVPQGGGDVRDGHRCAGEETTIALMEASLRLLADEMRYSVPPQDLTIDASTLPALPKSRFVMEDVQYVGRQVPVPRRR